MKNFTIWDLLVICSLIFVISPTVGYYILNLGIPLWYFQLSFILGVSGALYGLRRVKPIE